MKGLVGLIFLGVLYNQGLYIQELILLLDAEHFQGLLCVSLNMNSIPGLHTRCAVGQET